MEKKIESSLSANDQNSLFQIYNSSNSKQKEEIIKFLLLRNYDKTLWQEAAIFLNSIPRIELEGYLLDLYSWLQDLNWPGSLDIIRLLKEFPLEIFRKTLNEEVKRAANDIDDLWLGGIKVLCIEKEGLIPLLDKDSKVLLDKVEWVDWESRFLD